MPLTNSIRSYDPTWPQQFADEASRLKPAFGPSLIEIHHVGSTAVPELAAKAEIDILAVIGSSGTLRDWMPPLEEMGYRRGGDLSTDHHFFKRDIEGVRTHKLHICRQGHEAIARMLRFRDHLCRHSADRAKYQALKLKLERENVEGIGEYLAAKAPFIREVLARAN